ncbi:lamin tail domain-containing protein [Pseudomonas sp. HK3]
MIRLVGSMFVLMLSLAGCGGSGGGGVTVVVGQELSISGVPTASVNAQSAYSFLPTVASATGSVIFSISNMPSWASFNSLTGALTGTPSTQDIGVYSNIVISASDNQNTSRLDAFSITVASVPSVPSVAPPVINDQTKSGLAFSSAVAFTLTASDADSPTSSYAYSIVTQAMHGTVTITNNATSTFQYQPSSVSGINGDTFTIELSDGTNTSSVATVTLSFSDATAPAISLSPSNNASNVSLDTTFIITSDDPVNTSTITYNSSAGACTGTIQISKDNFTNCIQVTSAVASNLNRTITITASVNIDSGTEYKFKVTTGVANILGNSVAANVTNTFNTSINNLLITEVGESYYSNTLRFFEVYNPTSASVDMSNYTLKSKYLDGASIFSAHEFSLPSVTLAPGQYLVVRAQDAAVTFASNSRVAYVKDGTKFPYWGATGYIELLKAGVTEDFVTFGASFSPTTASAWSGAYATALPSVADQYGHSIGRSSANTDTNLQGDWISYDFATVGGVNDVTCTTDADSDGIPDCSEISGSTFAGLPLYEWGARTGQKDIFIEIDYMDSTNSSAQAADEGITPRKEALQKVVDVFAAQGIAVHFDVGDLYDSAVGTDPADFDLGGGEEVPFIDAMTFSTATSLYDYKLSYMDYARKQIFHYLMFANTQNGSQGSSGLAELNGNDLIVSLGEWGLNSTTTANTNTLINYQASTLMHELGHNLGLYHGGTNDSNNYEPNYFSIMNYLYQLSGLSTIGSDEGDRIYYRYEINDANYTCYTGLSNPPNSSTFVMDFSHGDGIDLDISSLNETLGLGQSSTDSVDYNCDGDKTDTSAVLLGALVEVTGTSTDHDDWSNINLDFQRYFSGDNSGAKLSSARDVTLEAVLMVDKVGDDRSPVAQEHSPSAAFFERLREQMTAQ